MRFRPYPAFFEFLTLCPTTYSRQATADFCSSYMNSFSAYCFRSRGWNTQAPRGLKSKSGGGARPKRGETSLKRTSNWRLPRTAKGSGPWGAARDTNWWVNNSTSVTYIYFFLAGGFYHKSKHTGLAESKKSPPLDVSAVLLLYLFIYQHVLQRS